VIGGQAIAAWNVPRETADFDSLVNRDHKPAWMDCLAGMKYSLFHDGGNFLQFTPTEYPSWTLELMLVSPETFAKMTHAAVSKRLLTAICFFHRFLILLRLNCTPSNRICPTPPPHLGLP